MAATPKRTDINFDEFRKRLLKERARLVQEHHQENTDMDAESEDLILNELSTYDINEPGDSAVQLYDRGRFEALDENTREMLRRIDIALARIEEGTYGICEVTGKPIPVERLRALPWATMTVEAAERTDR
ncbi:MAG TPA: TraR/DksA C4-type zinc finger protein [Chthonomonadaceae bacterium]|jgi:RNA polymerase-binding protein DksA|nr:TraR/DksA C4-type zinc finger protein [Chthonomonadaceae bacterium]